MPLDKLTQNLRAIVGRDQLLSEPDELLVYECDGLTHYKARPRAVVFPRSTQEVAEVVRALVRAGVPFSPRGAGTGLSGGALALASGVVIELARMRRLLKIDVENRLAVVETGLVNAQLSRAAAPSGLYYAPDPSSQATCTIGGNIAENAGGIHCLKYGVTVDHVLGARVVLGDGEVADFGGAEVYNGGYDLLGVFVGSEGTFGIATEATVRLTPLAPAVRTLLADFTDVDDASRAVSAIIAAGIIPSALEMVDGATIRAVEASVFAAGLPLDAEAALLVELDGLEAGLDDEVVRVESICLSNGARLCRRAADERERRRLWAARKGAFGAMGRITPDLMLQDAVVPRSRLPEVLAATYRIGAKYDLRVANVFHAGDGNLHPYICFDARNAGEVERVHEASREIMETCVRAGGTITGEHGVGLDKSAYLSLVFSDADLATMLRVRAAFDPTGLCNPGKIFPVLRGCGEARAAQRTEGERRKAEGSAQKMVGGERETEGGERETADSKQEQTTGGEQMGAVLIEASPGAGLLNRGRSDSVDGGRGDSVAASRVGVSVGSHSAGARVRGFKSDVASNVLARIAGAEHVGFEGDGESETLTVAPASAEEVAGILRVASERGWKVVAAGGATWLEAGNPLRRVDVVIKTGRMARIVEHEPADLVATAEAGTTLCEFNRTMLRAGQWLPLDPPDDGRATVGGIAATGVSGAQSFGYGAPRGHVLGMRVALAGGSIVRFGGRVVKNVAGYDLCKLFVGSYGTLGLILNVTFKLRPRPAREATLVAVSKSRDALLGAARLLLGGQLLPVAVEMLASGAVVAAGLSESFDGRTLLVRFAGTEASVGYQIEQARGIFERATEIDTVETVETDAGLWSTLAAFPLRTKAQLAWRAMVRPSELGSLLAEIDGSGRRENDSRQWQASVGEGRLRVVETAQTDAAETVSSLEKLRRMVRSGGGSLVIESAPREVKHMFDAWGIGGVQATLMRRIKNQLDGGDMFSPGRFLTTDVGDAGC